MQERGITLVEVLVVIFIISIFSTILVADFPKIKLQFSLSRSVYKFAQELRRTQDIGLSGAQTEQGGALLAVKGYGAYVDASVLGDNKQYIIYGDKNGNEYYDPLIDYTLKTVDFASQEKGIIIKEINNTLAQMQKVSINFRPPSPTTKITELADGENSVDIVFAIESDQLKTRTVSVNTSGLIETK